MTIGFANKSNAVTVKAIVSKHSEFSHTLGIGETGSGKTTSFICPVMKERLSENHSLFVFDEKGTLNLYLKALAEDAGIPLNKIKQLGIPEGIRINLISGYNEKKMIELASRLISESSDIFWSNAGRIMLTKTFLALKSLKELMREIQAYSGIDRYQDIAYVATEKGTQVFSWIKTAEITKWHEINIDINTKPLTFSDIGEVFSDAKNFILLCDGGVSLLERMLMKVPKNVQTIKFLNHFAEIKKDMMGLASYSIKLDMSEPSGNNGVFMVVATSVKSMMNASINDPLGEDINSLLEEGNHIVVNCEAFTLPVISSILGSVLSRFTPRAKLTNKQPVTLVIDEANRVLSKDSDLHIDILREAHVEIILVTQNEHQMIEKFGGMKWMAFQQNFVDRIAFSSGENRLEKFEYTDRNSEKVYKAEPIFFTRDRLMKTELRYQREMRLYTQSRISANEVIIFDKNLYDDRNQIIIYEVDTQKEYIRDYIVEDQWMQMNEIFNKKEGVNYEY